METVIKVFESDEQMKRVKSIAEMGNRTFCVDYHCSNLLVFHYSQKPRLSNHYLVRDNHLYLQDKSSCVAAHTVRKLLTKKDNFCLAYVSGGRRRYSLERCRWHSSSRTASTVAFVVNGRPWIEGLCLRWTNGWKYSRYPHQDQSSGSVRETWVRRMSSVSNELALALQGWRFSRNDSSMWISTNSVWNIVKWFYAIRWILVRLSFNHWNFSTTKAKVGVDLSIPVLLWAFIRRCVSSETLLSAHRKQRLHQRLHSTRNSFHATGVQM